MGRSRTHRGRDGGGFAAGSARAADSSWEGGGAAGYNPATMDAPRDDVDRIRSRIDRARLIETATRLIAVPSPTGHAGAVSDRLAEMLGAEGFAVERPDGGYPASPAVVVRHATGRPGPTLQFDGHLDTVHLPFVPPRVEDGMLRG